MQQACTETVPLSLILRLQGTMDSHRPQCQKGQENIRNYLTKRQILSTHPNSQGVLDEAEHLTVNMNTCSLPDCCLLDSDDSIDS